MRRSDAQRGGAPFNRCLVGEGFPKTSTEAMTTVSSWWQIASIFILAFGKPSPSGLERLGWFLLHGPPAPPFCPHPTSLMRSADAESVVSRSSPSSPAGGEALIDSWSSRQLLRVIFYPPPPPSGAPGDCCTYWRLPLARRARNQTELNKFQSYFSHRKEKNETLFCISGINKWKF